MVVVLICMGSSMNVCVLLNVLRYYVGRCFIIFGFCVCLMKMLIEFVIVR